ncbi:DedA family protein [Spelaeicoccus albus]|uniref:Membrane protein DedA with SNARE-associated domain n=1 Tax=Spelaeicoccus albus TaxID=1280376 RepID=A0A7Z0IIR0_9MICO|nr:VTT domain-containing protein [Spelaeicoccus albus]NYI68704.1 membrane protein DedA with SNARE-associated domain [Spelaeicoccus albus]
MNELVAAAASSIWLYPLITVLCLIDGVFPPVPSEILVVAAASLAATVGHPNLPVVMICAAVGAAAGDLAAYAIGRFSGLQRLRRWSKIEALLDRTADGLEHRTVSALLTARFIPVGRIVANFGAGALGLTLRRFVPIVAFSAACWAVYTTVIGISVGPWLSDKPLLGIAVAVGLALVVGAVIDKLTRYLGNRRRRAVSLR